MVREWHKEWWEEFCRQAYEIRMMVGRIRGKEKIIVSYGMTEFEHHVLSTIIEINKPTTVRFYYDYIRQMSYTVKPHYTIAKIILRAYWSELLP